MTRGLLLSCAGLLALAGAGCAGQQATTAQNPMQARVAASQRQSEEALKRANEAQKKAAEQAQRTAEARQEVGRAQQALTEAQQKAEQEQQRAQQLQQEANQATQQASREAQRAQQMATEQLTEQGQMVERGVLSVAGSVSQASARSVTVQTQDQGTMTFRVTNQTRVLIDGRQSSASEIQPGADARVAYQVGGLEPAATSIQVMTGSMLQQPGGAPSQGTGAGGEPPDKSTGDTGSSEPGSSDTEQ